LTLDTHPDHNIIFAGNPIENSRLLLALVQILSDSLVEVVGLRAQNAI
jgi:hypothetical protein